LPLSNGKFFYPDFVALLNDGRILVIEYKGEIYVDVAQEKKNIGEKWEEKSAGAGKALFLMAVKRDEKGRSVKKQKQAQAFVLARNVDGSKVFFLSFTRLGHLELGAKEYR
jgi:type III restriction enzyme